MNVPSFANFGKGIYVLKYNHLRRRSNWRMQMESELVAQMVETTDEIVE